MTTALVRTMPRPAAPRLFKMGTYSDGSPFLLATELLSVHMAVLGASGSGKSKCLELLLRHLMMLGEGGMLVDPAGDLSTDLMAFAAHRYRRGDEALLRRIHYLEVRPNASFHFDPAARAPLRGVVSDHEYYSWLRKKVDDVVAAFLRRIPAADAEVMVRLKRWMKNVLTACLVATDARNTHVGLHEALTFTNPQAPAFEHLFGLVASHLPDDVLADFRKLIALRDRPLDQERWLESTVNRLREVLSPPVREMFRPAPGRPPLDLKQINDKGHFVLANLRPSTTFSQDQKVTVGGLLIDEILNIKKAEQDQPKEFRRRFTLVVDECGEFIGEDLMDVGLRTMRKENLCIVLGAQNMHSLSRGDLELGQQILSLCDSLVCFRQKTREDKEAVADAAMTANLDWTRVVTEVQRQRGWNEHKSEEHSYSTQTSSSRTGGSSTTRGRSSGWQTGQARAVSHGVSRSTSEGRSDGESDSFGEMEGWGAGESAGASPVIVDGEVVAMVPTLGRSTSQSGSRSSSYGRNSSTSVNRTDAESSGWSDITSTGESAGTSSSTGVNRGWGETEGEGHTVSYRTQLLPNIVSEWEWNGLYEAGSPADQREQQMQEIHTQDTGEAIFAFRGGEARSVAIDHVREYWKPLAKWEAAAIIKRLNVGQRKYNFDPSRPSPATLPRASVPPGGPDAGCEGSEENPYGH